jgi:D-ribose pyranase
MKEVGPLNAELSDVISRMGHRDEMIVCDAGFAIPPGIRIVDLSLAENKPTVPELLEELKKYFSVEKLVFANETKTVSPTQFKTIVDLFGKGISVETVPLADFRERSKTVKAVVRTGDFTAYSNVLLVSGAGDRWNVEKP